MYKVGNLVWSSTFHFTPRCFVFHIKLVYIVCQYADMDEWTVS